MLSACAIEVICELSLHVVCVCCWGNLWIIISPDRNACIAITHGAIFWFFPHMGDTFHRLLCIFWHIWGFVTWKHQKFWIVRTYLPCRANPLYYTVSQIKFPPLNSVLLCQILTDFENFCTAGNRMKFATKAFDTTCLTLGMLLHYLGKLKIQIFCRYLAYMEENANKLHFKCPSFNSSMCVTVYSECIYVFLSKSCPRHWIPCWLLTNTVVTSAVTNFRCHKLIAKVNK